MTNEDTISTQYRGYIGQKLVILAENPQQLVLAHCFEKHNSALIWKYGDSGKLESLDLFDFGTEQLTQIVEASCDLDKAVTWEVPEIVYKMRPTLRGQQDWRTYLMLLTSGHTLARELVGAINAGNLTDEMRLAEDLGLTQVPKRMNLGRILETANLLPHRVEYHRRRLNIDYCSNRKTLSWSA